MLVGDDEALPRDDDAGAERRLLALAALAIAEAVAEEAAEEGIVEQRRDGPLLDLALGEDVHHRRRRLLHHRREGQHRLRSEEHTSELQSLMRSSYAVFCLKKKK